LGTQAPSGTQASASPVGDAWERLGTQASASPVGNAWERKQAQAL